MSVEKVNGCCSVFLHVSHAPTPKNRNGFETKIKNVFL